MLEAFGDFRTHFLVADFLVLLARVVVIAHQRHQAALDLRCLKDIGLVAFHLGGQLALLLGQRGDARLRGSHRGTDPGGIQVGGSRGGDPLVARSLERVDLALDRHHIRVRFSVFGQQARILRLQAWQVLRVGRNGLAVGGLGWRAGVGCGQFQLQVAQFFLRRLVVAVHFAELKLRTRQHAHAQLLVFGQCVGVGLLEVGQLVFQVGQLGTELVGFLGEEFGGFGGAFGTLLHVLVEEQRHQFVSHFLGHFGAFVFVGNRKGHGGLAAPLDVGAERGDHDRTAHLFDLVGFAEAAAAVGEQVVLVDDPQQVLASHHALADDLDTLIGKGIVAGRDQVRGDLLRLHQNGPGRLIDRRNADRHPDSCGHHDHYDDPQQQGTVLDDGDVIFDRELVLRLHSGHQSEIQMSGYRYVSVKPAMVASALGRPFCWRSLYINEKRRSQAGENARLAQTL